MLTIEEFSKLDLRIATILSVEEHPNADRLWKIQIQLGEEVRQIVGGIRAFYTKENLIGRQIVVVANLEPATIRGEESAGMLLAAKDSKGQLRLVSPDGPIASGAKVG
ncbi:MAG: hypothetical protein KC649_02050 [Candidatus Omnitrophica bacterium]|nr:hypothetical protein [Candidatus Omnitrophota bacterium]